MLSEEEAAVQDALLHSDSLVHDVDSPMSAPSHTTSVASEPNTVNQLASAALQRLHGYIDSQLANLVGAAVEQALGSRYNQLADTINEEIESIKNHVLRDEDHPMDHDEFEENHHQNRQNRKKAADTKGKNKRIADDDDVDEEDEEDENAANCGQRRKAPVVLTVHNYSSQFLHEPNDANIVCPPYISSTEGADGKGGVRPPK